MNKYIVTGSFYILIEAENPKEAVKIASAMTPPLCYFTYDPETGYPVKADGTLIQPTTQEEI